MKNKIDVYMLCELIVFFFASSVIFHTVTVAQLGGALLTSQAHAGAHFVSWGSDWLSIATLRELSRS